MRQPPLEYCLLELLYSKSPLLRTPLLRTIGSYGQKNPRSVTFFNSVIKTPLLRTLLMDIRQLRTLLRDIRPLQHFFCPD